MPAEQIRHRRPSRNHPIPETDPNPPQIQSIIQSTRCKSAISSLLLSTFNPTNDSTRPKKNKTTGKLIMGLGCAAPPEVSVPAAIRSSANWEAKRVRKKKQRRNRNSTRQSVAMASNNNGSCASAGCGPGIGLSTDAASVDCVVVSRRPVRERSSTRRIVRPMPSSFLDSDNSMGVTLPGSDEFRTRYRHCVRERFPDGLAEIMILRSSMLIGGRSSGSDRYRDWRLNVDSMSYEELLELGDKIGYVNTGLNEDEIVHCLRKTKLLDDQSPQTQKRMGWKCIICQEEYKLDDEMGRLECGHFYHTDCIKQWLLKKNVCPICKTAAAAAE